MKKDTYKKESTAGGLLTGALAGMALGAAAVVLSKKENRRKIKEKIDTALEMGENKINEVSETMEELKGKGRKTLSNQIGKAREALEDAKDKTQS